MSFLVLPTELYSIQIYDHAGTLQRVLRNWNRLEFHQRVNNAWNCQVTLSCAINSELADFLRSMENDWFTLIYRIDPLTLQKSLVYEGFHITLVDQVDSTGNLIFNIYGGGYADLLKRRVVIPPAGSENLSFAGPGESVLKAFVNSCMLAPVDPDRVFPGVTIEADGGLGLYTQYDARYINLYSVCQTVADASHIDFGIYGSEPPGRFYVRGQPIWGLDRRVGNGINPVMIFDLRIGNMEIPILSKNSSEEKNYIYVGGDGAGEDRTVIELQDAVAIARSPWGRKEAFIEGRQQVAGDPLEAVGYAYLRQNIAQNNLTFDIRQTVNSRWLRDWGLGDIVTARYFDFEFDKHITEVSVIVSGSETGLVESLSIEMEDYVA